MPPSLLISPPRLDLKYFGIYAWYSLIFLQPFNQFGALRILFTWATLVCLAGDWKSNPKGSLAGHLLAPRIAAALALWAIIVSALGPYPLDSLHSLRRDLLVQTVMLLAALRYIHSPAEAWRMISVAIAGFAAVSLASTGEVITFWVQNGIGLWVERNHSSFWGGYASTGSLMIPLLLGWLLLAPKGRVTTAGGWTLVCLAISLVFLYGARTPFLAAGGAVLLLLVLLKRWQGVLIASLIAVTFSAAIQMAPLGPLEKYRSLLDSDTYVTNSGLSQRLSVWEGCWQIIIDRPLTGYGYGWKKLAWAINDKEIAEHWLAERPDIADYYLSNGKASYGKVNPHNYFLQVMFEIGVVGLLLAIAFWIAVVRDGTRLLGKAQSTTRDLSVCLVATLSAYALANVTNGLWVGSLANLSLAFAGSLLSLARMPTPPQANAPATIA